MELTFVKCRYDEVADQYPEIHGAVFGEKDPAHFPGVVWLIFEARGARREARGGENLEPNAWSLAPGASNYVGFFSGYYHDAVTLYIQRMGIPKDRQGQRQVMGILRRITDHLRDEGHRFVMARIAADNRIALMLALRDSWQIHGVQTDTAGQLYVQVIKEL